MCVCFVQALGKAALRGSIKWIVTVLYFPFSRHFAKSRSQSSGQAQNDEKKTTRRNAIRAVI